MKQKKTLITKMIRKEINNWNKKFRFSQDDKGVASLSKGSYVAKVEHTFACFQSSEEGQAKTKCKNTSIGVTKNHSLVIGTSIASFEFSLMVDKIGLLCKKNNGTTETSLCLISEYETLHKEEYKKLTANGTIPIQDLTDKFAPDFPNKCLIFNVNTFSKGGKSNVKWTILCFEKIMEIAYIKTTLEMVNRANNNEELRETFAKVEKDGKENEGILDLDLPLNTINWWQNGQKLFQAEINSMTRY